MLPEDPVVLLVHADRVRDHPRLALLVRERRVEVVDLAEAVAAERERLRHAAEAPLARVERVLPAVQLAGVAVGHDHLADRRAVQDRTGAPVVVVGDLVQHEPFVRIEADAELHFCHSTRLPSTVKLGPSGCVIEIGLRSGAQARLVLGVVARAVRRQRRDAVVDDLDHLVGAHVEVHDQPFDRPRVAVVGRVGRRNEMQRVMRRPSSHVVAERHRPATGRSARRRGR